MKRTTIVLFMILMSCKSDPKTKNESKSSAAVKETITSKKPINKGLSSYCFFKLDDKYSTENDSITIKKWLEEKSQVILKSDSIENIFSQNGGGPNGAQWNPATDLYVAIATTSDELTELPKLYVNGKLYKKRSLAYTPALIWYVLSQDFWENEVRKIDSLDIKQMYTPEFLNGIEKGEFNPATDLDYGEILRIEISYGEDKLTKFFHATYGE